MKSIKRLKSRMTVPGHIALSLFLMSCILLSFSCEESTGPGEATVAEARKLLIYSDSNSISANGGSAQILVKVYADDDTTNAVSGVKVNFTANLSGIKLLVPAQNEITDAKGYARATLYAGTRSGTAAVTASLENFSNSIFITVAPGAGLVTAEPSSILANGLAQSVITATVIDSLGQPLSGAKINFESSSGTITKQAYSNENGLATATLRSAPSITDVSATVTVNSETGSVAKVAVADVSTDAVDEDNTLVSAAKTAKSAAQIGTTTVVFRGVTVTGTLDKTTVFANEADSTRVTVNIKETTTGEAVLGARIDFTTTLGTLRASSGMTDVNGNAKVVLFGGNVSGTPVLSATYAEGLFYTAELSLIKQLFMTVESTPSVLSANGSDIATIKAMLIDADNNPIKGETVYFKTQHGTILQSAVTNDWGEASVSLRSARYNAEATVTASYSTIEKTTTVKFSGADINIVATPLVLVADGESSSRITATLTDASGAAIVDRTVTVSTSLGTLSSADGLSTASSIIDSTSTEGKITVYLMSTAAGTSTISFESSGLRDSLDVDFTDYTFTLSSSASSVLAGGNDVAITAMLKDKDGVIIPIKSADVEFSPTLGTITTQTENSDGTVTATLKSGNTAGPATITASIKDPSVSASMSVMFNAADVGSITLESAKSFVRIGGNSIEIVARVFDITGNPKSDETVTFSISKGPGGGEKLDPGTDLTNDIGQATVSFVSGMTGSTQNGVEVQARIGSISDSVTLTITGQPESVVVGFDTENFESNANGTLGLQVSAIISDVNRNKVVDGTIVNFSIIGDVGVIDPEVQTVGGVASTQLIYAPSDAGSIVSVMASAGGKQSSSDVTLPGATGTVATITPGTSKQNIMADGVSTTSIMVRLTGTGGEPLSSQTVFCSADIGTIPPTALSGDPSDPESKPGVAFIQYTSPASTEDQVATLTFTSGDVTETIQVNVKGITMISSIDPEMLPSDGQSKAVVSVLIKETTTHVPITEAEVSFGATDGVIGGLATTDENGVAFTEYTSGYNAGTANIFVSYGKTLVDTVAVNISEVTARGIELFANPTQIAANGISQSTISALLRDDNFNPIMNEVIRFTTTLGTITAVDSTDESGRAEAVLESERRNGQAVVTATFKEHVKTIPVNFTGVKMSVSAAPENLFAGGDEDTEITAYLKDAAEVPIVGEEITFEWYMDDVKQDDIKAVTDVQGRASISLSSDVSGLAKIRVTGAGAADSTDVTFTRIQFVIAAESYQVATGGDTLQVFVQLYDTVNSKYLEGATVKFYTTIGTITTSSVTDSDGKAFADLVSGSTAGKVTVSASTTVDDSRVSADREFTFINASPGNIDLRIDANIVSIGGSTSALIAVVTDKYGNPVSDSLVSFKIEEGPAGGEYIQPPTVTTGASGTATTYFYSGQIPSDFEGVKLSAHVDDIVSNEAILTIAGAPELVRPSFNADWTLESINSGDGTYTLPISATVVDINSNGVVDGTTVYFKIDPAEGAVLSPVKTTSSVAVSSIRYPSAVAGREIKLTASAGGKEGAITFSLPGFLVSYLSVTASPKTILADGKSTTEIKATLFDKNGSSVNVPDGTTVSFTTDGGTLSPVVSKTFNGIATSTLTSDKTSNSFVYIQAQSGLYIDGTYVRFEEIGSSVNQVSDIEVKAFDIDGNENPTILADGISSVEVIAYLKKFDNDPVTAPTTVEFTSDIGQITNFVRSDSEGKAVARFSSGAVGTATIQAEVGNTIGYTSVVVNPGPPQSAELSFNPTYVNVKGAGKNETLVVTVSVNDSKGNPVADGNLVMIELIGSFESGISISPEGDTASQSSPVPTLNGQATVSLHAGSVAGAIRVKASVVDEDGVATSPIVSSETTQFLVHGGPAFIDLSDPTDPFTESRIKLYSGPINIYAGEIGSDENKSTITATVADQYNNPVPAGTAVYFTTTGGFITNATGYTDANGIASVTLYSSNPFPTLVNSSSIVNPNAASGGPASFNVNTYDFDGNGNDNDGIAVITAKTEGLDHNGDNATVWNMSQVIFSMPINTFTVEADVDTLYLGEVANITITMHDINGNPVVSESEISISATEGSLTTKSFTTDDPGSTFYTTSITNDLNPLTQDPGFTVVSVKLTSANGDYTQELSPPVYLSTSRR